MTQTKYTAEEWEVYGKQSPYLIREKGEYGKWVVNDVIDEANARLIASAPDLLEACKDAIRERMLHGDIADSITKIRKAVAKAEGQQ